MFITHYSDFTCGASGFFKSKAIGPFARHHWNYLGGPIDAMASSWTLTTRQICVYNSGLWTKIPSITVHDVSIWSVCIKSILTLIIFMEYPYAFSMFSCHYIDVIMTTVASQITSLTIIYSTVQSDTDQKKHQSSTSLAFVWGIHRDRWIPRTKGQLRGKCFHLMTSSFRMTSWHGKAF